MSCDVSCLTAAGMIMGDLISTQNRARRYLHWMWGCIQCVCCVCVSVCIGERKQDDLPSWGVILHDETGGAFFRPLRHSLKLGKSGKEKPVRSSLKTQNSCHCSWLTLGRTRHCLWCYKLILVTTGDTRVDPLSFWCLFTCCPLGPYMALQI